MNERRVEPLDVPGCGVPVQDLVGDRRRRQQQRRAHAYGQREGAHAKADLKI